MKKVNRIKVVGKKGEALSLIKNLKDFKGSAKFNRALVNITHN